MEVVKETSNLVLNSDKLQLHGVSLVSGTVEATITETKIQEKAERLVVRLSNALSVGSKITLRIEYEGKLDDSMAGYYRSSTTIDGKKRWVFNQLSSALHSNF